MDITGLKCKMINESTHSLSKGLPWDLILSLCEFLKFGQDILHKIPKLCIIVPSIDKILF